jgi:hypothetical protein
MEPKPTEPNPDGPPLTPEEFKALLRRAPLTALRACYLAYRKEQHRRRKARAEAREAAAGTPPRKRGRPTGKPTGSYAFNDPGPPPKRER